MGGDTGDREPRVMDLDDAERRSKYPHEPDMSWDEIEDRLRTADQAAVYQVFAYNERLGDLVARNGEELSGLRTALAGAQAEIARLRQEVAGLRATGRVLRDVLREVALSEGEWDVIHDRIGTAVVRALAAAPAPAEDNCGVGHDPERICCAHAQDVERLRVDRELHQDRADRLAVELMRLRDQIGEVIAADRRFENAPAPAREQADPADEQHAAWWRVWSRETSQVLGTFDSRENAEGCAARLRESGYDVEVIAPTTREHDGPCDDLAECQRCYTAECLAEYDQLRGAVAALLRRCDDREAATESRKAHGGGEMPALLTTAEVRALLGGADNREGER